MQDIKYGTPRWTMIGGQCLAVCDVWLGNRRVYTAEGATNQQALAAARKWTREQLVARQNK